MVIEESSSRLFLLLIFLFDCFKKFYRKSRCRSIYEMPDRPFVQKYFRTARTIEIPPFNDCKRILKVKIAMLLQVNHIRSLPKVNEQQGRTMRKGIWRAVVATWTAMILLPSCNGQVLGCEFPPTIFNSIMNSYQALLVPPDYKNLPALQQHAIFTEVFREMSSLTGFRARGRCSIVASALFPNMRIFMGSDGASEPQCADIARDFLSDFTPSVEEVSRFASFIAEDQRTAAARPPWDMTEAETIQNESLKHIYAENSAMHALVSVGAKDFETISAAEFIEWLQNQRLSGGMRLTPLVMCKSDGEVSSARPSNGGMPYSNIIPPQVISLAIPRPQSAPRKIYHAVMIGVAYRPRFAPQESAVERKYCGRENTFSSGAAGNSFTAWTRCLAQNVHNTDTWVTIFCIAESCPSAELAEKVAVAIANDSELVALGKDSAQHDQPRGPYLIKLIDADK
jgi:hypothetical protein